MPMYSERRYDMKADLNIYTHWFFMIQEKAEQKFYFAQPLPILILVHW